MPNWTQAVVSSLALLLWVLLAVTGLGLILPPVVEWVTSKEFQPQHATLIGAGTAALVAAAVGAFTLRFQIKSQSNAFKLEVFKTRLAVLNELCRRCARLRELVVDARPETADRPDPSLRTAFVEGYIRRFNKLHLWALGQMMILPNDVYEFYNVFLGAMNRHAAAVKARVGDNTDEGRQEVEAADGASQAAFIGIVVSCRDATGLESLSEGTRMLLEQHAGH